MRYKIIALIAVVAAIAIMLFAATQSAAEQPAPIKPAETKAVYGPPLPANLPAPKRQLASKPKSIPKSVLVSNGESRASYYDYALKGQANYSKVNATAASRDYPRGTKLKVTNVQNRKSIVVVVNDYGPQARTGRQIDLSSYAFSQIGSTRAGVLTVQIEKVN